jgi:hypothetical protein
MKRRDREKRGEKDRIRGRAARSPLQAEQTQAAGGEASWQFPHASNREFSKAAES